jgi:hypothetical protein
VPVKTNCFQKLLNGHVNRPIILNIEGFESTMYVCLHDRDRRFHGKRWLDVLSLFSIERHHGKSNISDP